MSTTGMVMTVTDELLAELEEITSRQPGATLTVRSGSMMMIYSELRRLRAEKAELAQSLAESRANDQAAMGWLTSLRWASGDRGERMLPELVSHIEGLAKDAGRYRYLKLIGRKDIVVRDRVCHLFQSNLDSAVDTAMATQ